VLLVGAAALYLWNLSASGYANEYYAAAVQAGTTSWKTWLFGSLDSGNAITVDKPPASLWVMTASARIFGFSSWSLLVPQALMGVAAVALLRAAVRRWAGPATGIAAGAALALTPAAVLMFRFDNPDALLTLLLVAGAYAMVRAVDAASTRAATWWVVAAGAAVGFGFLTKMGQALLVLPAFGLVYLLARPGPLRTRLSGLGAGLVATVVSAGWFVALVELWPEDSRPYIGGSTTNSLLELASGYNGIGRLLGGSGNGGSGVGGGGGAGGGNSGFGGEAGIDAPVLHGRARAGDRRARGHRCRRAVAIAVATGRAGRARTDAGVDGGLERGAAAGLGHVVRLAGLGRRRARGAGPGRGPRSRRFTSAGRDGRPRRGARRVGGDGVVRVRDGRHRALGEHPVGGVVVLDVVRRFRWGWLRRRRDTADRGRR